MKWGVDILASAPHISFTVNETKDIDMSILRTETIENAVNSNLRNPYINLYKGKGYWYFVYDDPVHCIYRERIVYVNRLNDLTFEQWCESAEELIFDVKEGYDL